MAENTANPMEFKKVVLTGATGLIGVEVLRALLLRGVEVLALTRDPKKALEKTGLPAQWLAWESHRAAFPLLDLDGVDAVIHLSGESVGEGKWTLERKKEILDSRVESTSQIVKAFENTPPANRPKVFLCASAIGVFGDTSASSEPDHAWAESDEIPVGDPNPVLLQTGAAFLAGVTREWEKEALKVEALGVRTVRLRTGIVLDPTAGALGKLIPIFSSGGGGPSGSGKQWMSWIHLQDQVNAILFAMDHPSVSGALHLTAPEPARNSEFAKVLGEVLHRPSFLPAPGAALRAGLGEMADLVLGGQKVVPSQLLASGFVFHYSDLRSALENLCGGVRRNATLKRDRLWVKRSVGEVFEFFCDEKNLEAITPPWLNFKVLGKSTPQIELGTLIDYKLSLHGVPMKWRTEIAVWERDRVFVDQQLRGPYRQWHHTHRFTPMLGGTLIEDEVAYKLPIGMLGHLVAGAYVRKDVGMIFDYRRKVIGEKFSS
jgi:uncharacterized protein (TIGR01777 family)